MKIKDLIKELSSYNQEMEVFLSKDAEGNEYKKIFDIEQMYECVDDGEIVCEEDLDEIKPCVVIFPE